MSSLTDRTSALGDASNPQRRPPESVTLPPVVPSEGETLSPAPPGIHAPAIADGQVHDEHLRVPGYEIERELGRGGMGVVYQARQIALNRTVALKMILAGGHAGPDDLERFRTEAEAIARIQHPHVVQVFEVGQHGGLPFFSLEFCSGGSLEDKLGEEPLPALEAATLVEKLARGMQVAHEQGVIHRDLKPANVLLTADATPRITDFGMAKKLNSEGATVTGAVMGTPPYMAPEQAGGRTKELGPACDIYALGAILYECLTTQPPFKAATPLDTLLQVLRQEPVPPTQLNGRVPRDLETICLKCLHKEPERRYATAGEMADDLGRFQRGEPILARPVGTLERGVKWVQRNAVVSALAAAVLLVLVVGVVVSGGFAYQSRLEAAAARKAEQTAEDEAKAARRAEQTAETEAAAAREAEKKADDRARAEAAAKEAAEVQRKRAEDEARRADAEKTRAEEQLSRAEMLVYAGKLSLAQSAFAEGNGGVAVLHLDECQWNLRGWEHRYLWTRLNSKQTFLGHTAPVSSVAFSPDGQRIVTRSEDQTAKVWDAAKGQEVLTLKGHTAPVTSVAFSPDGNRVFSWDAQNNMLAWSTTTGRPVDPVNPPARLQDRMARSPDGFLRAEAQRNTVAVRDTRLPPSDNFWPFPDRNERIRYHTEKAALAEKDKQWFAAAFHLGRLLLDQPDEADFKRRRDDALNRPAAPSP